MYLWQFKGVFLFVIQAGNELKAMKPYSTEQIIILKWNICSIPKDLSCSKIKLYSGS